jgi:hypothetical protein
MINVIVRTLTSFPHSPPAPQCVHKCITEPSLRSGTTELDGRRKSFSETGLSRRDKILAQIASASGGRRSFQAAARSTQSMPCLFLVCAGKARELEQREARE